MRVAVRVAVHALRRVIVGECRWATAVVYCRSAWKCKLNEVPKPPNALFRLLNVGPHAISTGSNANRLTPDIHPASLWCIDQACVQFRLNPVLNFVTRWLVGGQDVSSSVYIYTTHDDSTHVQCSQRQDSSNAGQEDYCNVADPLKLGGFRNSDFLVGTCGRTSLSLPSSHPVYQDFFRLDGISP